VGGADALQSDFDVIERNHYDVFRQRAYAPRMQQIRTLPVACCDRRCLTIGVREREEDKEDKENSTLSPPASIAFTP